MHRVTTAASAVAHVLRQLQYFRPRAAHVTLLVFAVVLMVPVSLVGAQDEAAPATDGESVYVIPIQGNIEPGISHFLDRSLDQAAEEGASVAILDIDTPGGRLDSVLEMRDSILESEVPTVAFVNREAFSAGALITIASDEIWMAPGAVYGAATPVVGAETADAKTISAVRSTFQATAIEQGRDPQVAEAMVDPDIVVEDLSPAGSLLSLSTSQAEEWNYVDGTASNLTSLIDDLGYAGAEVVEMSQTPIETLVRWVTDPVFAGLLIMAGLFLIVGDALFGGFGLAALGGAGALGLFFFGHLLAGLAGWEDLVLIVIGLVLLGLEVFVLPGFGIPGILGLLALGGGLFMTMVGRGFWEFDVTGEATQAAWSVTLGLLGAIILVIVAAILFPRVAGSKPGVQSRGFGRLTLTDTVDGDGTAKAQSKPGWLARMFGGDEVLERGGTSMPDTERGPSKEQRSYHAWDE